MNKKSTVKSTLSKKMSTPQSKKAKTLKSLLKMITLSLIMVWRQYHLISRLLLLRQLKLRDGSILEVTQKIKRLLKQQIMVNSQFISGCYALSQLVSSTWFTLMKKDVVKKSKNVVKQDKSINKRKRVHDTFFYTLLKEVPLRILIKSPKTML